MVPSPFVFVGGNQSGNRSKFFRRAALGFPTALHYITFSLSDSLSLSFSVSLGFPTVFHYITFSLSDFLSLSFSLYLFLSLKFPTALHSITLSLSYYLSLSSSFSFSACLFLEFPRLSNSLWEFDAIENSQN